MATARTRTLRGEIGRFLTLGAANTVVTTVAFYLLSLVMPPSVAFTIVYVCALAYLALLTPRYVFRARLSTAHTVALAGWYVLVYLVGLSVIRVLEHAADLDRWAITVGTVAVTSPLSFIGSRLLVGAGGRRPE